MLWAYKKQDFIEITKIFKPSIFQTNMAETLTKGDFVEIEFTAKIKNSGEIFDTNKKEDAKTLNLKDVKPFTLAIGHSMLIPGLDKSLEGKEVGKNYEEEFSPVDAFGIRHKSMVRMIPMKAFLAQKIYPQQGMQLSLDGMIAKVISVSGGRVLVDFNNPLSGKAVIYNYTITKKLTSIDDKVNSLQDYFFKQRFEFTTTDKEVTFKLPEKLEPIAQIFAEPFEKILGMKIKAELIKEEKDSKENPSEVKTN